MANGLRILIFFLTLLAVPLRVQLNILWKHTVFHKLLYFTHGIFQDIFHGINGVYHLAQECKNISVIQDKATQWNRQVLPPIDEFITIPDLPTITLQQKYSLQATEEESYTILVPEQDWTQTQANPQRDYRPLSPAWINQHMQMILHKHQHWYRRLNCYWARHFTKANSQWINHTLSQKY